MSSPMRQIVARYLPGGVEFLLVLQHFPGRGPYIGLQVVSEYLPMDRVHGTVIGPGHDV